MQAVIVASLDIWGRQCVGNKMQNKTGLLTDTQVPQARLPRPVGKASFACLFLCLLSPCFVCGHLGLSGDPIILYGLDYSVTFSGCQGRAHVLARGGTRQGGSFARKS